jgi:hypothetical protein
MEWDFHKEKRNNRNNYSGNNPQVPRQRKRPGYYLGSNEQESQLQEGDKRRPSFFEPSPIYPPQERQRRDELFRSVPEEVQQKATQYGHEAYSYLSSAKPEQYNEADQRDFELFRDLYVKDYLRQQRVKEAAANKQLNSNVKVPTEIAAAVAAAAIPIGEILILLSLGGLALTIAWKDEKTGKVYTISSYTLEQIANTGNFVAQVSADIYNAVGDKIASSGITLEKFTKIVDENLGKIPGFPGTSDQVIIPNDTRHTGDETRSIPTGTPPTDFESGRSQPEDLDTGNRETPDLEMPVLESRHTSKYKTYQRNAPQVPYKNEVHHVITVVESEKNEMTKEAHDRGIWSVDETDNLIRLPSTAAAYQQSSIKIKHRGSHGNWSGHVQNTLQTTQDKLENQYGTLDNVPDAVLKQTIEDIEDKLQNELLDKNLGRQKGWITPQPDGTDRLSTREKDEVIA